MTDRITNIDGKVYTIDGCYGCPFYDNGDNGYDDHCQYPEKPSEHPAELCLTPPDDCPLRESQEKSNKDNLTLKPCPFCGSAWVETGRTQDGHWYVGCNERYCHAMLLNSKWAFQHEQDAVDAWNRRVKE